MRGLALFVLGFIAWVSYSVATSKSRGRAAGLSDADFDDRLSHRDNGGSAKRSDPARLRVRWCVRVPESTPTHAAVYVTGGHPELGNWSALGLPLEHDGPCLYCGELEVPAGTVLEYKFTRGSWEAVETLRGGIPRPNRGLAVLAPEIVHAEVEAVSAEALGADMWHGAGVTANGFALRFDSGGAKVRMFDNACNPTTTNINIAALTGIPATGHGGRGDSVGFHGNGRDAYVQVNRENTSNEPYITVLNADGTLRWTRRVGEEGEVINATRVDGAIAPDGRAIAVWASPLTHTGTQLPMNYVQARLFKPDGTPFGSRFLVSEWERPDNAATTAVSVGDALNQAIDELKKGYERLRSRL